MAAAQGSARLIASRGMGGPLAEASGELRRRRCTKYLRARNACLLIITSSTSSVIPRSESEIEFRLMLSSYAWKVGLEKLWTFCCAENLLLLNARAGFHVLCCTSPGCERDFGLTCGTSPALISRHTPKIIRPQVSSCFRRAPREDAPFLSNVTSPFYVVGVFVTMMGSLG